MEYRTKPTEYGNIGVSRISMEEAEAQAKAMDESGCTGCVNCEGCTDCKNCTDCEDCENCIRCKECDNCANCKDCMRCTSSTDCKNCQDCADCMVCSNCSNCTNCVLCKTCEDSKNCKTCTNCMICEGCKECEDCTGCTDCDNCTVCTSCTDCTDCELCVDCKDCDRCTECVAVSGSQNIHRWDGGPTKNLVGLYGIRWDVATDGIRIQIGCKNYSAEEWEAFPDRKVKAMDYGALEFWRIYKDIILSLARLRRPHETRTTPKRNDNGISNKTN